MLRNKRIFLITVFFGYFTLTDHGTIAQTAENSPPDISIKAQPEAQVVSLNEEASVVFMQKFNFKKAGIRQEVTMKTDKVTQTIILNFGGEVNRTQAGRITQVMVDAQIFTSDKEKDRITVKFENNRRTVKITKMDQNTDKKLTAEKALIEKIAVSGAFSETGTHPVSISTTVAFQNFSLTGSAVAQVQAVKGEIVITEILNGRKNKVGDFSQETDPDIPMRLFVDTTEAWNGTELVKSQYDMQRVSISASIKLPKDEKLGDFRVLWKVTDPDDPATDRVVDPNRDKGGDNTGKDHERKEKNGESHWFTETKGAHKITAQTDAPPAKDSPRDGNTVLGSAKTKIDAQGNTSVFFNFSDHGGDNFIITATLVKNDDTTNGTDKSGILTVWRKRFLDVYAMDRGTKGVFDVFEKGKDRFTAFKRAYGNNNQTAGDKNVNTYIDFVAANADKTDRGHIPRITSVAGPFDILKADKLTITQDENPPREITFRNVRTDGRATPSEIRAALTTGGIKNVTLFVRGTRVLIPFNSIKLTDDAKQPRRSPVRSIFNSQITPTGKLDAFRILNPINLNAFGAGKFYPLFETNFHVGKTANHRDGHLQLIGAAKNIGNFLGGTELPHSFINVQLIEASIKLNAPDYERDLLPIKKGAILTITTKQNRIEKTTVVRFGDRFDGAAPVRAVAIAINAAITADGENGAAVTATLTQRTFKLALLSKDSKVESITVSSNEGISDNLGFEIYPGQPFIATRQTQKTSTAIHEVGHSLLPFVTNDDYHTTLVVGQASASSNDVDTQFFAPKIVQKLRGNIQRSFSVDHNNRPNTD